MMNIYEYLDVTEHVGEHRGVVRLPQPPEAEGQYMRQKTAAFKQKNTQRSVCRQRTMGVGYLFKPESIEPFGNSLKGRNTVFLN